MAAFPFMMRCLAVPNFDSRIAPEPAANDSPAAPSIRGSLKFLATYAVAIVNGVALLYILVRLVLVGIHRFLNGN